jgi:hypothetical protein
MNNESTYCLPEWYLSYEPKVVNDNFIVHLDLEVPVQDPCNHSAELNSQLDLVVKMFLVARVEN